MPSPIIEPNDNITTPKAFKTPIIESIAITPIVAAWHVPAVAEQKQTPGFFPSHHSGRNFDAGNTPVASNPKVSRFAFCSMSGLSTRPLCASTSSTPSLPSPIPFEESNNSRDTEARIVKAFLEGHQPYKIPKPNFTQFKAQLENFIVKVESTTTHLVADILKFNQKSDQLSTQQFLAICKTINSLDLEKCLISGDRVLRSYRIDKALNLSNKTLDVIICGEKIYIIIMTNSKSSNNTKLPNSELKASSGSYKVYKPAVMVDVYKDFKTNLANSIYQIARHRVALGIRGKAITIRDAYDINKNRSIVFNEVSIANQFQGNHVINLAASEEFTKPRLHGDSLSIYLYAENGLGALRNHDVDDRENAFAPLRFFCSKHGKDIKEAVYAITEHMILALKQFHDSGTGHFDFKDRNLILFEEIDPTTQTVNIKLKLCDFGSSVNFAQARSFQKSLLNHLGFKGNPSIENNYILNPEYVWRIFSLCKTSFANADTQADQKLSIDAIEKRIKLLLEMHGCPADLCEALSLPIVKTCDVSLSCASPQVYHAHLNGIASCSLLRNYYRNKMPTLGRLMYDASQQNSADIAHYQHDILDTSNDIFALGVTIFNVWQEFGLIEQDQTMQDLPLIQKLCALDPTKRYTINQVLEVWKESPAKLVFESNNRTELQQQANSTAQTSGFSKHKRYIMMS